MKVNSTIIAIILALGSISSHLLADDPENPFLCKGMLCTPDQQCPEPEPAPNCNQPTKAKCNAVKRPDRWRCNTGSATSCVEAQPQDQCQSTNFQNECGAAECAYCEWNDDLKACVPVGECTMGTCNTPCS